MSMITTTREFITPAMAKSYLETNTKNVRELNARKVAQYAEDIKNGRWQENGESIKFYEGGVLFDGQHRLAAIVKCNVGTWMMVMRGINKDVTLADIGAQRLVYQLAKVTTKAAGLAAALMLPIGKATTNSDTKAKAVDFCRTHKVLLENVPKICGGFSSSFVKRGLKNFRPTFNSAFYLAALEALNSQIITPEQIQDFCKCSNSGMPIDGYDSSAPLMHRKMFIEGTGDNEIPNRPWSTNKSLDFRDWCSISYLALDAFSKGTKVKKRFDQSKIDFEKMRLNTLGHIDELEKRLGWVTKSEQ